MNRKIPIEIVLAIILLLVMKLAMMFWAKGHDEVVGNDVSENKTTGTTTTNTIATTTTTTSTIPTISTTSLYK